jgi:diaminopimelate decarboxylase
MKMFGSMEVIDNNLFIGGISAKGLSDKYGTPLYVYDESLLLDNIRRYKSSFSHGINEIAYAGKAFLTIAMCQLLKSEGISLDVVSGGELYTALKSGFPMNKVYFHGNNKTEDEIIMGIENKVGRFVVDNYYELQLINKFAKEKGMIQDILIRVSPGISAHTHKYIMTGQADSKFGFSITSQETLDVIKEASQLKNIKFRGIHSHIGSQIFETEPYLKEIEVLLSYCKRLFKDYEVQVEELDLGGGFGIYYKNGDEPKEIEDICCAIIDYSKKISDELNIKLPKLIIEPGRSIVGNAGTTLYTIGSIKDIKNVRKYVSVDGGMTDNIRPALYDAEYECIMADGVSSEEEEQVTISGKCCESGDILLEQVIIPKAESGDILAVLTTGAYGYSMSSNYNKIRKAAVIFVKDSESKLVCRRQSYEDMIKNEIYL